MRHTIRSASSKTFEEEPTRDEGRERASEIDLPRMSQFEHRWHYSWSNHSIDQVSQWWFQRLEIAFNVSASLRQQRTCFALKYLLFTTTATIDHGTKWSGTGVNAIFFFSMTICELSLSLSLFKTAFSSLSSEHTRHRIVYSMFSSMMFAFSLPLVHLISWPPLDDVACQIKWSRSQYVFNHEWLQWTIEFNDTLIKFTLPTDATITIFLNFLMNLNC